MDPPALDVVAVYDAHADFVWRELQRLGVRESDLDDVFQEVFLVVHKRLSSFNGTSLLVTWLHGICVRVVAGYRRRAWFRRETPTESTPEGREAPTVDAPDELYAIRQARGLLARVLASMDTDKRDVFVMYEIDELTGDEMASILGVPIGTVWSRLSAARKQFQAKLLRHGGFAREEREPTPNARSAPKGGRP